MGYLNDLYRQKIQAKELKFDQAQQKVIDRFDQLYAELDQYSPTDSFSEGILSKVRKLWYKPSVRPKGIYLVGLVGRGKSMLMDLFYHHVPVEKKKRTHFHIFMQEVHKKIHNLEQQNPEGVDPVPILAKMIGQESWLLCFDEFQINDIADAMILGRLFEHLFKLGVIIVTTSNTHIKALFQGRPGADAFKPFIFLLQQNMLEIELSASQDYRLDRKEGDIRWLIGCTVDNRDQLDRIFMRQSNGQPGNPCTLTVRGHILTIPWAADKVVRFQFEQLCDAALGAADYLALAENYETLIIDNVPIFNPENRNMIERFTILIDILYEHRVQLYVSAAADWQHIYPQENRISSFERTISRLYEMQSQDWTKQ